MKILVVEDEPVPREGLVRLLRENSDWTILEPCADGLSGLESIKVNRPDLVISDIRMPGSDGIEMIRSSRELNSATSLLVLSGYADFEYARQCLTLGVTDYLLKPVTSQTILDAVRSIEDSRWSDFEFLEWLEGRSELCESGVFYHLRTQSALSLEQKKIVRRDIHGLSGNPKGTLKAEIPETMELFFLSRGVDHVKESDFGRFVDHIQLKLGCRVLASASRFPQEGAESSALLRRRLLFLMEPAPKYLWGELAKVVIVQDYNLNFEKDLLRALSSPLRQANGVLETFRREYFRFGFDPASALQVTRRFFFFLMNQIKETSLSTFETLRQFDPASKIEVAFDHVEVAEIFRSVVEIVSAGQDSDQKFSHRKIGVLLNYLNSRWNAPPSLAECAEELGLSPEYLSRLFKAEKGVGFAKYVTKIRMDLAKSRLAEPDKSVQEVAVSLGFPNPKYFCSVFRKETGFTPSEYRDRFS